jgi:SAM-dependent methyltransferase
MAARAGAEVHAVDISPMAVRNAVEFAKYNGVAVDARIMDLHHLGFPDGFFDVVYGSAVLHHLDPTECGREFGRVLRPGGTGYFEREPCDRNALLRLADRVVFGSRGGSHRRQRFLFLKRLGSEDEAPLSRQYEEQLRTSFPGDMLILHSEFVFFQKVSHLMRDKFLAQTSSLDGALASLFPWLLRFSYHEDILLRRSGDG